MFADRRRDRYPSPSNGRGGEQTPPSNDGRNGEQPPASNDRRSGEQPPASNDRRSGEQLPPSNDGRSGEQPPASNDRRSGDQSPFGRATNGLLPRRLLGVCFIAITTLGACDKRDAGKEKQAAVSETDEPTSAVAAASPQLLYLPDGGDVAIGSEFIPNAPPKDLTPQVGARRCPNDMVDVAGAFCIDRYEVQLVDERTKLVLSPYYPAEPTRAKNHLQHWARQRASSSVALGRALELPELPEWQLEGLLVPLAVSNAQVVPSGYLDANTAERACMRAGKRLCTAAEWVTACRGQQNRPFPYGSHYEERACNVFRQAHPAHLLHGNASEGHLDPRLNLVEADGGPLLRVTGGTPRCKSDWGNDAVYDMVGNLDEWVDDPQGAFHGGFYSRSTKLGCDARITTHPRQYSDYSLGARCCR